MKDGAEGCTIVGMLGSQTGTFLWLVDSSNLAIVMLVGKPPGGCRCSVLHSGQRIMPLEFNNTPLFTLIKARYSSV